MLHFGVDYYPEHWPQSRWPEDARMMAQAGMNVVRLAEFAWSKMEPGEAQFDFAWLDSAIDTLYEQHIDVILGTPTASPPPWLMAMDDTLFLVGEDGRRLTYGNRREYCPNHPLYHAHSCRIVEQMAAHYKDHPAVIGWQIDNEFGARCYCDICRTEFQRWLTQRYESLGELNAKWGTVFWSHTYGDWSEIPVPQSSGGSPNPGLALDYDRFMSESYCAFQKKQIDILRRVCPDEHFITHNLMGFKYPFLDYFDLARDLDLVSWDVYPRTQWNMTAETQPSSIAMGHDAMRGLKVKNFWVMEQQSGSGGWEHVSVSPQPGEIRLWAYQSIAHGADGIVFFRWRTNRFGTEQYWHGVLDHHGIPGRRYEEVCAMGHEMKRLGNRLLGAQTRPRVAIISSYDSRFAFQVQGNNPRFDYADHVLQVYQAFFDRQVPVDIVEPTADLSHYSIVVAPALHVLSTEVAENLERFAYAGGLLVVTPRTGVKDEWNAIVNCRLPGLLAELCGVEVEEYVSMPIDADSELELSAAPGATLRTPAQIWCDVLQPRGATVIGNYTQGFFAGKPAITVNNHGGGLVYYVGTLGSELYGALVDMMLPQAGIEPLLKVPDGVEVAERWQADQRLLFLLNHTSTRQEIVLDREYEDLIREQPLAGKVTMESLQVIILA